MLAACYGQQNHPIFAPPQYSLRAAKILRNIAPAASVLHRGCEGSTAAALLLVIAELPLDSTNSVFHEIGQMFRKLPLKNQQNDLELQKDFKAYGYVYLLKPCIDNSSERSFCICPALTSSTGRCPSKIVASTKPGCTLLPGDRYTVSLCRAKGKGPSSKLRPSSRSV